MFLSLSIPLHNFILWDGGWNTEACVSEMCVDTVDKIDSIEIRYWRYQKEGDNDDGDDDGCDGDIPCANIYLC